jgi:hypothetical protein
MSKPIHRPKEARMTLLEHEARTLDTFKAGVEDLALENLGRLEAERVELEKALASVKDSIRLVRSVLAAARPDAKKQKAAKPKKQGTFVMSEERETEAIQWFTEVGPEFEITSARMRDRFPNWSGSYVNMTLKELRDTGVLRLAATSGGANVYRSLL